MVLEIFPVSIPILSKVVFLPLYSLYKICPLLEFHFKIHTSWSFSVICTKSSPDTLSFQVSFTWGESQSPLSFGSHSRNSAPRPALGHMGGQWSPSVCGSPRIASPRAKTRRADVGVTPSSAESLTPPEGRARRVPCLRAHGKRLRTGPSSSACHFRRVRCRAPQKEFKHVHRRGRRDAGSSARPPQLRARGRGRQFRWRRFQDATPASSSRRWPQRPSTPALPNPTPS